MPLAEAKGAAIYPPTPLPRHCEARSTVAACSSSSEADGFSTAGLWHARSSALTSAEQASRSDLVRVRVRVRVNVDPNPSPDPSPNPNPNLHQAAAKKLMADCVPDKLPNLTWWRCRGDVGLDVGEM